MEGYDVKDKKFFFFFEFLGTMILTVAFNFVDLANVYIRALIIAKVIFIVSFVSWEVSAAHFNPAVTLGSYLFTGNLKENMQPMLGIIAMQVLGILIGIFITWYLSLIQDTTPP